MKANQLLFQNSINVDPRMGTIKLNDKRMTLMSTEALGFLRRDLVATLGMERAKGFLLRYGRISGYNDAESIMKMYNWKSKKELILAGPAIHTLEGVVTSEIDTLEVSDEKLYMSGFWRNSFEAEEHISHFGYSNETVCWMLVGYSTGFIEKIYGKKVVVYESCCVGKGDDRCYVVAETVEDCNPEQRDILHYYEEESLVTEFDKMYDEVKNLNNAIIRSEKFNKHLSSLLLEGKELSTLISAIADVLGKSVVIDKKGLNKPLEFKFISQGDLEKYQRWKEINVFEENMNVFNIMSNKKSLGRLIVIGSNPMSREEQMIIDGSLTVLSIHMFTQRSIAQSLWQQKTTFFEEVIENKYNPRQFLQKANHLFDINLEESSRVIVIKSIPEHSNEEIRLLLSNTYPSYEIFMKNEYVVMILHENSQTKSLCTSFLFELEKLLESYINHTYFYIGVGRTSESILEIGDSYKDAFRISSFLSLAYPTKNKVAAYEQLDPIMLFLNSMEPKELLNFSEKTLGKLKQYDQENEASLIQTLKVYLDNNGNLNQTAAEVNLSIPGLRYRLEKIKSLCDVDLKTGQGSFHAQLALQTFFAIESLKN